MCFHLCVCVIQIMTSDAVAVIINSTMQKCMHGSKHIVSIQASIYNVIYCSNVLCNSILLSSTCITKLSIAIYVQPKFGIHYNSDHQSSLSQIFPLQQSYILGL